MGIGARELAERMQQQMPASHVPYFSFHARRVGSLRRFHAAVCGLRMARPSYVHILNKPRFYRFEENRDRHTHTATTVTSHCVLVAVKHQGRRGG